MKEPGRRATLVLLRRALTNTVRVAGSAAGSMTSTVAVSVLAAMLAGVRAYDGPSQISVEIGNLDKDNYRKVSR